MQLTRRRLIAAAPALFVPAAAQAAPMDREALIRHHADALLALVAQGAPSPRAALSILVNERPAAGAFVSAYAACQTQDCMASWRLEDARYPMMWLC